jgi:hypothetical protein
MPALSEFPTIVQHAVEQVGTIFANAPERRHFAEYLTGLLVAEKKTVSGINAEFAQTTDQSCLNRWIRKSTGMGGETQCAATGLVARGAADALRAQRGDSD